MRGVISLTTIDYRNGCIVVFLFSLYVCMYVCMSGIFDRVGVSAELIIQISKLKFILE